MHTPEPTPAQLEARVTALEEQLAWMQHTLQALDDVVRGLGADNQRLHKELGELSGQLRVAVEAAGQESGSLLDDVPPHY